MVSFLLTLISFLDVPVFWPILSSYWVILFLLTMKRQIMHMLKYKYNPFRIGTPVSNYELLYNWINGNFILLLING